MATPLINSPAKYIKTLEKLNKIEDPIKKYVLMTKVLPPLLQGIGSIKATEQEQSAMAEAALKAHIAFVALHNSLQQPLQAQQQSPIQLSKKDTALVLGGTLASTACIAGVMVNQWDWSKWNPFTYLIAGVVHLAVDPVIQVVKENSVLLSCTALTSALMIGEDNWSAWNPYTYVAAFGFSFATLIANEKISQWRATVAAFGFSFATLIANEKISQWRATPTAPVLDAPASLSSENGLDAQVPAADGGQPVNAASSSAQRQDQTDRSLVLKEKCTLSQDQLLASRPALTKNKAIAYDLITKDSVLEKEVTLEKYFTPPVLLQAKPLFENPPTKIIMEQGNFSYPAGPHHWTANFGDKNVFYGSATDLCAQDEIQALEHPILSFVHNYAKEHSLSVIHLEEGHALLVQGAVRRAVLDTETEFEGLQELDGNTSKGTLYGKNFGKARKEHIEAAIQKIAPQENNLFVMSAPDVRARQEGSLYSEEDIWALLHNSYTAFKAIQRKDPDAIVHTGNWGCGAWGNDPTLVAVIQLAAARMAGIKEVHYYPLNEQEALVTAAQILNQIEATGLVKTADGVNEENPSDIGLVNCLVQNAKNLNFRYRRGDGN